MHMYIMYMYIMYMYVYMQSWALEVFLIFSIIKNDFFCIFYKVNNLFLHQSYLKIPLPVKLT